jgi:AraC-like DNA-binding protein
MVVKQQLKKLGLHFTVINLGEVETEENISSEQHRKLKAALHKFGLELIEDKRSILIEKIKKAILEQIYYTEPPVRINFSKYLSEKLNYDYTYLANLFSSEEGVTIEHYIILCKIERVKELLVYNELSLKEISYKLNYSSLAHLSNQFKKVTGLAPSQFRQLKDRQLMGLENV